MLLTTWIIFGIIVLSITGILLYIKDLEDNRPAPSYCEITMIIKLKDEGTMSDLSRLNHKMQTAIMDDRKFVWMTSSMCSISKDHKYVRILEGTTHGTLGKQRQCGICRYSFP